MILASLDLDATALERETGWTLKPEGLCKDGTCVPLERRTGDRIDARDVAAALGMPLVGASPGPWALGPAAARRVLTSALAPDLVLPDLDGRPFRLSALRGEKILLVAWAPW